MKPIDFKYSNCVLKPGDTEYSENVESVVDLPVWSDDEQCVSCWKPTLRERLSILLFGRVWLALLSGHTQPPACIVGTRRFLGEAKEEQGNGGERDGSFQFWNTLWIDLVANSLFYWMGYWQNWGKVVCTNNTYGACSYCLFSKLPIYQNMICHGQKMVKNSQGGER